MEAENETARTLPSARTLARGLILALLGCLVGTYSTLCGIGGGIFAVPILHYLYGMSLKAAIGNSLVVVAASTSAATFFEIARSDSALNWPALAVLVPASLAGTQIGYRIARKLDTRKLKMLFCIVLVAVGLKVYFTVPHAAGASVIPTTFDLSLAEIAAIGAIGIAAGILAPLLGIGGGLVAVPGLFLTLPSLGYAGARACSTAMSVFNAWQSVWLFRRQRLVQFATAAWFAGGALLGGFVGDELIHKPSIVAIAQKMLSLTLLFVAARFAWDLWHEREVGSA